MFFPKSLKSEPNPTNPCVIELGNLTTTLPSLTGARGSKEEVQFDLLVAVALREQRGRVHVAVVGTVAVAWRRSVALHRAPPSLP